jgi:hypothetical protein
MHGISYENLCCGKNYVAEKFICLRKLQTDKSKPQPLSLSLGCIMIHDYITER